MSNKAKLNASIEKIYSLTSLQEGILYHSVKVDAAAYLVQNIIKLDDDFNELYIEKALHLLSLRHDVLRTMIAYEKISKPKQIVLKEREIEFKVINVQELDESKQHSKIEEIALQDAKRGFDLQKDSLLRVIYIKQGGSKSIFIWSFHHIIMDGWCLSIIMSEFLDDYMKLSKGIAEEALIEEIRKQKRNTCEYSDYIKYYDQYDKEGALKYWKVLLCDYEGNATVMPCNLNPIKKENKGIASERQVNVLSSAMTSQLEKFAANSSATLSMVLEMAWGILLQKYSGNDDVVFGKVVSGRNVPLKGIEQTVGLFINTIPIRMKTNGEMSISSLIQQVKEQDNESLGYERSSLAEIQECTEQKQDLIKTLFVYENYYIYKNSVQTGAISKVTSQTVTEQSSYDLNMVIGKEDNQLKVMLIYNGNLYDCEEIKRILTNYECILYNLLKQDQKLSTLQCISQPEYEEVTCRFNDTAESYDRSKTIIDLFEEHVDKTPHAPAVFFDGKQIDYQRLNAGANAIATKLRAQGAGRGKFVVIMAKRSLEMIYAIYGVLKSGAAYVPVDPDYPYERIRYIIENCHAVSILTFIDADNVEKAKELIENTGIQQIDLSNSQEYLQEVDSLAHVNCLEDPAYVIYTSGTTGNPKGVVVSHGNLANFVRDRDGEELNQPKKYKSMVGVGNITFDIHIREVINTLSHGMHLIFADKSQQEEADSFIKLQQAVKIDILLTTPSRIKMYLISGRGKECFAQIKRIYLGGEAVEPSLVRELMECTDAQIMNIYGPSETTVWSTKSDVFTYKDCEGKRLPIGKPICNTQIYILQGNNVCGIGMPGELCIAGDGVSLGYLAQPALTKEKFIENPVGFGKMYRSRDLARWLPDGSIDYLGRIDEQVKIRGLRIELGEISSVIKRIKDVLDCAVILKKDPSGEMALHAYIVAGTTLDMSDVKKEISKSLASYMVPSYMMQIEKLPVTQNGKLDKRALPQIIIKSADTYEEPQGELETLICELFSEITGAERVGRNDSFFDIGGHSLKAMTLVNLIERKTEVRLELSTVFKGPKPWQLATAIQARKDVEEDSEQLEGTENIQKAENKEYYDMSPAQRRIYITSMIEGGNTSYNIPAKLHLAKGSDIERIKECIQKLIRRHESLRTSFHEMDGRFVQKIHDQVAFLCEYKEYEEDSELIGKDFVRPFDLSEAPCMHARIVKVAEETYLLFDLHHIITDGVSMTILAKEFMALYQGETLQPLTIQYKDYSEWLKSQDIESKKAYWVNEFKTELPVLELPADHRRKQTPDDAGATLQGRIDDKTCRGIKALCSKYGCTEYMVMLSGFMVMLSKYSRQEDIVVGSPVAGRINKDVEKLIGMFVNTLALRGRPRKDKTFVQFLLEVKETCIKGFENQEYPYEELVEQLDICRDITRNPLFDVMFVMQNATSKRDNQGIHGQISKGPMQVIHTNISKFDLTVALEPNQEEMNFSAEYKTSLYEKETIQRMMDVYSHILREVARDPEQHIGEISVLGNEQAMMLCQQFNHMTAAYDPNITIAQLFEEQVAKTPDRIALSFGEKTMTYRELNEKANVIAHRLRDEGVQPGDYVAMYTSRSLEMVCGIYGIVKSGGAYVPINTMYPKEKVQYILKDCKPKAVLTYKMKLESDALVIDLEDEGLLCGEENKKNPECITTSADALYVIYTSGTTGQPKGVIVENRNVVSLLKNDALPYEFSENDVWTMFHSYGFDFSVWEMYGATLNGGRLIIVPEEVAKDSYLMVSLVEKEKVTVLNQVPSSFYNLMVADSKGCMNALRYVIFGGEALNPARIKDWSEKYPQVQIVNMYGITETTVHVTYQRIGLDEIKRGISDIGKPLQTLSVYIMQGDMLCSAGMPGEICVAGAGVARGYLNREDLTKKKFVKNPYGEGRLYRSGDLGRWLSNGNIEYLGRIDDQIKIRGFRVELGEIDHAIRKQEIIKDCAVIMRKDETGEQEIYAYLISDEKLDINKVREALSKSLASYMVPSYMMQIEKLPVTQNGKLDKRALPQIKNQTIQKYLAPKGEKQELLCKVYEDVLGVTHVGIKDSFFELGGDSIKAIRIVSMMRKAGYEITVNDIMVYHTVEAIEPNIKKAETNHYRQGEITGTVNSTPILNAFEEWSLKKPEHFNQSMIFKTTATYEEAALVLNELVKHHDILRAVYIKKELTIKPYRDAIELIYQDLTGVQDEKSFVKEKCDQIQSSFILEEGPLIKAAYFNTRKGSYLMLCIHHLIVDGVSWRILLEDYNTALQQIHQSNNILLPEKTASYKEWADALSEYSESYAIKAEKDYWENLIQTPHGTVLHKMYDGAVENGRTASFVMEFSKDFTINLQRKAVAAFQMEINQLLLCALGLTMSELTGQKRTIVTVEGHGRENLHKKIDISRTIGWFTSMYPVVIEDKLSMLDSIIGVRDMMQQIPNKGIGYGLLKEVLPPLYNEILFNYLGELNIESEFSAGSNCAKENQLIAPININGGISNNKLTFIVEYDTSFVDVEFMNKFRMIYEKNLKNVTDYCIEALKEHKNEPPLYPISSGQMRFYILQKMHEDSLSYNIPGVMKLEKKVDVEDISRIFKSLIKRHEVLRTRFVEQGDHIYQQVLGADQVELSVEEISLKNESEIKTALRYFTKSFLLDQAPLIRVGLARNLENEEMYLFTDMHHIISDLNSIIILNREFHELLQGKAIKKEAFQYRMYVNQEIENQKDQAYGKAEEYLLEKFKSPFVKNRLPVDGYASVTDNQVAECASCSTFIEGTLFKNIKSLSRKSDVLLSETMTAAYMILLSKICGTKDCTVGMPVNTRNYDNFDNAIGLYLNTVAVRVNVDGDKTNKEILKDVALNTENALKYQCYPMERLIEKLHMTSKDNTMPLFETIFNYTTVEQEHLEGNLLESEETEYNLTWYVREIDNRILIRACYKKGLYTKEAIQYMVEEYTKILENMCHNADGLIREYKLSIRQEHKRNRVTIKR